MIIIMFDAHKLDISDELKSVLDVLKPHQDKVCMSVLTTRQIRPIPFPIPSVTTTLFSHPSYLVTTLLPYLLLPYSTLTFTLTLL